MSNSTTSTTEERALALLGNGVPPGAVANALGVDPSRITQLLGEEGFAARVVEKKFESLSKHSERDSLMDGLEDKLLEKLKDCLPYMIRPMELLKAFSVINAAKRRSLASTNTPIAAQTVVTLNMPQIAIQKFTLNINNQVISVGDQTLVTMQSGALMKTLAPKDVSNLPQLSN